jgi:DNA-binding response OmpR family regulator
VGKNILLVEDHPRCTAGANPQPRRFGYEILEANNGSSRIALTLNEVPDLVLVDLSLYLM